MSNLPPHNEHDVIKVLKKIWEPILAILGVVIFIVQFIQLWQGNQEIFTWVTAISGIVILTIILFRLGFGQKEKQHRLILPDDKHVFEPRYPNIYKFARIILILILAFGVVSASLLYQKMRGLEKQVVIVLTHLDGPDVDQYRVTEIIWESLYSALKDYTDVKLVLDNTSIRTSPDAARLGKKYNATIVIWGWYGVTNEAVKLSVHFDVLRQPAALPSEFHNQDAIKPLDITEFATFNVQDELSGEMTFLSLMTVGLARYSLQDWDGAISSFDRARGYTKNESFAQDVQYYIDLSQAHSTVTNPDPNMILIVYAAENIPQGTTIKGSQISYYQVPRENYASVMFTHLEDLIGKTARFSLDQGLIITSSMVGTGPVEASGPAWAVQIPSGMIVPIMPLNDLLTLVPSAKIVTFPSIGITVTATP